MTKYFLFFLLPYLLFGDPNEDLQKDKDILKNFDVDASFLKDKQFNNIKSSQLSQYKKNSLFQDMGEGAAFIPNVKEVLDENKIPPEFLFVAIVESNFSAKATSKRHAGGVWQFMPDTAKRYNLRIDKYVDERRDLIKSSRAAAKYLSILHNQFGKWYLAAIAYNCGSGYLANAIKKAKTDNLHVLLDEKKKYLPPETRRYIRKILSLAIIENDEGYLLGSANSDVNAPFNAPSLSAVEVNNGESLTNISTMLNLPQEDLKKFNKHLRYDFTPPDTNGYNIYIPSTKLAEFHNKYGNAAEQNGEKKKFITYIPKREETSLSHGTKFKIQPKITKDPTKVNQNKQISKQEIIIPVVSKTNIVLDKGAYTVKDGETLESIAKANKVSVASIKSKNNIKNDILKAGDKLYINE